MKNFEKFKTAEERVEAYVSSTILQSGSRNLLTDFANWLDSEAYEEKPLPCPGCGNTDMHVHDEIQDPKVYIVCPNCGYSSPGEMKLESSVRRHNEIARAVMAAKKKGDK